MVADGEGVYLVAEGEGVGMLVDGEGVGMIGMLRWLIRTSFIHYICLEL
jgi:hypothetical protein